MNQFPATKPSDSEALEILFIQHGASSKCMLLARKWNIQLIGQDRETGLVTVFNIPMCLTGIYHQSTSFMDPIRRPNVVGKLFPCMEQTAVAHQGMEMALLMSWRLRVSSATLIGDTQDRTGPIAEVTRQVLARAAAEEVSYHR